MSIPVCTLTLDGVPNSGDFAFKTFVVENVSVQPFDQFQPDGVDRALVIHAAQALGQTVTVGRDGQLSSVELSLSRPLVPDDDLSVEVFLDADGIPVSAGEVVVPSADIPVMGAPFFLQSTEAVATLVDLKPLDISVTSGDVIELRLNTQNTVNFYSVRTTIEDRYPGGRLRLNGIDSSGDMAFKVFVREPGFFEDGFESGRPFGMDLQQPVRTLDEVTESRDSGSRPGAVGTRTPPL